MAIEIISRHLNGLVVLRPQIFEDRRGFFMEAYHADQFEALGLPTSFVQDNYSRSSRDVLRGLHFQWSPPQGKVLRVTRGTVYMVAVDIRPGSPTLGQHLAMEVSAENRLQLWVPAGFASGFCVVSDRAELHYKCTATYNPGGESTIRWDDPELGIAWPLADPVSSKRDAVAQSFAEWLARPESDLFAFEEA